MWRFLEGKLSDVIVNVLNNIFTVNAKVDFIL